MPLSKLAEIIERGEKLSLEHGFEPERVYRYAHIGDGHPHYNFIALNAEERVRAETLRREFCKLAVSLGGTVAGEHGIGKLRKDLLALEAPSLKLRLMRALKKELDPNSIMAPGNIIS